MEKPASQSKLFWSTGLLILIIAALLVLGTVVIQDFGEGVDEWHNSYYGELFLGLYTRDSLFQPTNINYYNGPFYFMVFTVTSRIFSFLNSSWLLVDGRHLTNWITFLIGTLAFFDLVRQLFSRRVAWLAIAGFLTQPLLIGHAFINQKDTPMMVFFIISLTLGFRALKSQEVPVPQSLVDNEQSQSFYSLFKMDWDALEPNRNRFMLVALISSPLIFLGELWSEWLTLPAIKGIVSNAYELRAIPLIQNLFNRVATDAYKTPLELYLGKVDTAYLWFRPLASLLLLGLALLLLRHFFTWTYQGWVKPFLSRWLPLLLAGILLGLTTSIRLAGLLAGALISAAFIHRLRLKAILPTLLYWMAASLTIYLVWPVLWGDPLGSLFSRVLQTNEFSSHDVLFNGLLFPSEHLPWQYAPSLIGLQLTIPVLLLFVWGIFQAWSIASDPNRDLFNYLLVLTWLIIPLVLAMTGTIPIYNNFRHILFVIPSILIIAGVGAAAILSSISYSWARVLLLGVVLLAGLLPIIRLHPYQYLYYNELVGGVHGAEGRFELDYWCTAMREAMVYVNGVAPEEAKVAVWGGYTTASPFKRNDLELYRDWRTSTTPDFALGCRDAITSPGFFPQLDFIKSIEIDRATLAIVKGAAQ